MVFKIYVLLCLATLGAWSLPRSRGECRVECDLKDRTCAKGWECQKNGCRSECVPILGDTTQQDCPPLSCLLACPLGLVRDKQGCEICMCKYNLLELGY